MSLSSRALRLSRRTAVAVLASWLTIIGTGNAADMNKTLHVSFQVAETGFDPQAISDLYSEFVNRHIFDALYSYDYLARPYKLVPNTAAALPEITDNGLTWVIKIRKGILYADDPAFNGKKRELTADDYIYAWKRLLDPKVRSPYLFFVDDKFIGADAVLEAAKKTGKLDYGAYVTVVAKEGADWLCIQPPAGSISWVQWTLVRPVKKTENAGCSSGADTNGSANHSRHSGSCVRSWLITSAEPST